jgi:CRP-like cAMP-binding protein
MPANWPLFAAHVQISGEALEITPQALRSVLKRNRRLHDLLLHYSYLLSEQIGQGVACLRYHSSEERLARLILELRERVASNPIPLTHAEIAISNNRWITTLKEISRTPLSWPRTGSNCSLAQRFVARRRRSSTRHPLRRSRGLSAIPS